MSIFRTSIVALLAFQPWPLLAQFVTNELLGVDGFNVYCTSNNGGTGTCMSLENRKVLQCIVIPGQVIDCTSAKGRQFQCTIYSQVNASQAEFYCNRNAELLLIEDDLNWREFDSSQF